MLLRDSLDIDTSKVKTGDIFLQNTELIWFRPLTWFSWMIRKATRSVYNHTSEALWINWELYMIESLWSGITLRKRYTWVNTKIAKKVSHIRMHWFEAKFDIEEYTHKALLQMDKKYDFAGIPKLFIMIVFGYWKNISEEKSEECLRCSEFTAWMKDLDWRQRYLPRDFVSNPLFFEII